MDKLVRQIKNYYQENPLYYYRCVNGQTLLLDKLAFEELPNWPEHQNRDYSEYSYRIKPLVPATLKEVEDAEKKLGLFIKDFVVESD